MDSFLTFIGRGTVASEINYRLADPQRVKINIKTKVKEVAYLKGDQNTV